MEKRKLDNGLLLIANITNVAGPVVILVYLGIGYFMSPETNKENLMIMIPVAAFTIVSFFMFAGFKKVSFDNEYVYVKNVFNKETDSFPISSIRSVHKMMVGFGGRYTRRRSGKNFRITYLSNDGQEKKVKFMSTISDDDIAEFQRLTAFLGSDGFNADE